MADPMRIRAQVAGDKATVRVLMAHEMEAGQRRDASGNLIPAWFIQEVTACSLPSRAPKQATRLP